MRKQTSDLTIDQWFQKQDKAADRAFEKLKARQEKGVFIEIWTAPKKATQKRVAPSDVQSTSLSQEFIQLMQQRGQLPKSTQNLVEVAIREFERGTLNTAGHDVAILKPRSAYGFFHALVVDGVIQGEAQVPASEY